MNRKLHNLGEDIPRYNTAYLGFGDLVNMYDKLVQQAVLATCQDSHRKETVQP